VDRGAVQATRAAAALEARATAVGRSLLGDARLRDELPSAAYARLCGPRGPAGRVRLEFEPGSHRGACEALVEASRLLPTPWIAAAGRAGPVRVRGIRGRSYFDPERRLLGLDVEWREEDALHELVHVVEDARPALRQAGFAFLARRARGKPLRPLYEDDPGEVGVPGLRFAYAGRVYCDEPVGPWTEALAAGVTGALLGSPEVDRDHLAFALGVLASL
jgi:hypothetical protein